MALRVAERAATRSSNGSDPAGVADSGAWRLWSVQLGTADDQHLFDIGIQLQYADEAVALRQALEVPPPPPLHSVKLVGHSQRLFGLRITRGGL